MTGPAPARETWLRLPFDPDCLRFVLPLAALAAAGLVWGWLWLWIPALALTAAVLGFFRDPPRNSPEGPGAILSPADGKVVLVEPSTDPERGPVPGTRIVIFLSVLNCHVNRAPAAGVVRKVRYERGLFLDARDPASSEKNESNWIFMDGPEGSFTVRQLTGLIARRIVCRVREGTPLARGERLGLIRFGSRTELFLPERARPAVKPGDVVKGGLTVMARLEGTPPARTGES